MKNQKVLISINRLDEIDIIRSLVIIVLVAYHAFAPFVGSWESPKNCISNNQLYCWIGRFLYAGMLETFVFISGYVFALSCAKKDWNFSILAINKLKRLYVPCLIFGFLFILLFRGPNAFLSLESWSSVLNGCAHLWFLPMLFWCFLIEKSLNNIGGCKILFLFLVAILPYPTLPLRLNTSLYYLFFFHIGYISFSARDKLKGLIMKMRLYIPLLFVVYIFVFYFFSKIQLDYTLHSSFPLIKKAYYAFIIVVLRISYSSLAVVLYYVFGVLISQIISIKGMRVLSRIAMYSFGIYIFQEILLRLLYYKTSFCLYTTQTYYPVLGWLVVFIASYVLSYIFKNTRYLNKLF